MTNVDKAVIRSRLKRLRVLVAIAPGLLLGSLPSKAQNFFPLKDVRAGMHGVGRTIFQGNRIEDFQVEILGVLQNAGPKQSVILARLSGGPLAESGVIQGMSGSPVYIEGRLLGAVALGFAFSKVPIAGIQPIEQMIDESRLKNMAASSSSLARPLDPLHIADVTSPTAPLFSGGLSQILTPLAVSGLSPGTLQTFSPAFRKLGFEPLEGVSAGSPISPDISGNVAPGSMISVQLLSGDMSISADGTVTYVDGKHVYAFGHQFLNTGSTELPFAKSEVLAVLPTLNTSFKLAVPKEWIGTITSDRNTAIAGEIGRRAHTIPATITVKSAVTGSHVYHFNVVNDRLLTPFITQTALFSSLDCTERSVGAGTLHLTERISFENGRPPLELHDTFVSDSALSQQVALNAVVSLSFLLSSNYSDLKIKEMSFVLEPVEAKRQLYITQAWTSAHVVRPGDAVEVTIALAGENGVQMTRSVTYQVPTGAPAGQINITVSDSNTLNFPDYAGMNASSARNSTQLIELLNKYRGSQAAYVRVWRAEPAFTISGPSPGGELTDPPPSIALVLADPSTSPTSNAAQVSTRGSGIAELIAPVDGYVVSGAKTLQVEVKE
jgi:SpoIVB peptidase S55